MLVFSKTRYKRLEGERRYEKNKRWVDKYHYKQVENGRIVGTCYKVKPEWCCEKPGTYTRETPAPVQKADTKADTLKLDMSKAEIVKVDYKELHKQTKEAAIQSGHYCLLELCIPRDEEPACKLDFHNVNSKDVAIFIADLTAVLKDVVSRYPSEAMLSTHIRVETDQIPMDKKENEDESI